MDAVLVRRNFLHDLAPAEEAVERIRQKHGYASLQRGIVFEDRAALGLDVRHERPAGLSVGEPAAGDLPEGDTKDE